MQISELTLRLILLFFPGVICTYIINEFTNHTPTTPLKFVIQSFTFGVASYFVFWSCLNLYNNMAVYFGYWNERSDLVFLRALVDTKAGISYKEIAWTSGYAVAIGMIITVIDKYKILFKFIRLIGFSKKIGELDIWGYTFNLKEVEWASVLDYDKDRLYDGWVQSFSDDGDKAEILLRDVYVYQNTTRDYLWKVPMIYLSLQRGKIEIEFRAIPFTQWGKREYAINNGKENNNGKQQGTTETTAATAGDSRGNG